jgi:hypothetical protein
MPFPNRAVALVLVAVTAVAESFNACEMIGPEPFKIYKAQGQREEIAWKVINGYIKHHTQIMKEAAASGSCSKHPTIYFRGV